jgi:hypothetical protein
MFANPWVGIAGSVASLVGVLLAVYFYDASIRYPELVYYVSPARAVVVKQGTASRLAVSFDGRPIAQDATAVQLAIWNRGKEPIRHAAVLQPLVIRTDGKTPILEATIRRKSRDVVQLEVNQSRMASGELELSWNVLEGGDGGALQIVYAGGPDVRVHCTGVFEGQPAIRELRYSRAIKSPSEQLRSERYDKWLGLASGVLAGFVLIVGLWSLRRHKNRDPRKAAINLARHGVSFEEAATVFGDPDWQREFETLEATLLPPRILISTLTVLMPLALMALAIYVYVKSTVPEPPFGFP